MATVTQDTREVATFVTREPRSVVEFSMRETAQLGELLTLISTSTAREVALLNDTVSGQLVPTIRDVALLSDDAAGSTRGVRVMRESAVLASAVYDNNRIPSTLREVAEFVDRTDSELGTNVLELGMLGDAATPKAYSARTAREAARLTDRAIPYFGITFREVGTLNDGVALKTRYQPVFREVAEFVDRTDGDVRQAAGLREQAVVVDRLSAVMLQRSTVTDVGYISDNPSPPPYGRAYTASIASWAMSTFSNYRFLTMAGNYAAGENLWRLDAADDYGTPITSQITTGVMDMGAGQMKRPTAVYLAGSASEPLSVTVSGDVGGVKESYTYPMELRDQTDYRNNRSLIGKGFRSRFIQVKIEATATKYSLLSAEMDLAVSPRRL